MQIISLLFFFVYFDINDEYNIVNIFSSSSLLVLTIIWIIKTDQSLGNVRKTQSLFLLFIASWFTAECLYGIYNGILKIDAYPSFADVFYLAGYVFVILYISSLNKIYKIEGKIIVSLMISFSFIIFYFLYVLIFVFDEYSFSGGIVDLILLLTYPLCDIYIIVGGLFYFIRGKDISLYNEYIPWLFIFLYGLLSFIGDTTFGLIGIFNFIEETRIFDLFFSLAYMVLGISIIMNVHYRDLIKNK